MPGFGDGGEVHLLALTPSSSLARGMDLEAELVPGNSPAGPHRRARSPGGRARSSLPGRAELQAAGGSGSGLGRSGEPGSRGSRPQGGP